MVITVSEGLADVFCWPWEILKMNDTVGPLFVGVVMLLLGTWIWWIIRRGMKLRGAASGLQLARDVDQQAKEDLCVAAKHARGDRLTDEELLMLSYFAVRSGIATPEQAQLVRMAEVLKVANINLARATAADMVLNRS